MFRLGECWLERLIQPTYWLDFLYYQSKSGREFKESLKLVHDFTRKVIRDRKQQILSRDSQTYTIEAGEKDDNRRKAFLDLLLDHHLNK